MIYIFTYKYLINIIYVYLLVLYKDIIINIYYNLKK